MQQSHRIEFRQSRDFDEILRVVFAFVKIAAKPLAQSVLVIAGPFLLLAAIAYGLFYSNILVSFTANAQTMFSRANAFNELTPLFTYYPIIVILMFTASVVFTTVVNSFLVLYVNGSGGFPSRSDVWQKTKSSFLRIAGTSIVVGLLVMVAMFLLVLPALYVGIVLLPIFIMRLQEEISLSAAINRCFSLIKGYWWQTLGIVVILYLFTVLMGYIASIPQMVVAALFTTTLLEGGDTSLYKTVLTAFSAVTMFVSKILSSIVFIGIAFQYYNLVERKEAVGLQERIHGIEPLTDSTLPPQIS